MLICPPPVAGWLLKTAWHTPAHWLTANGCLCGDMCCAAGYQAGGISNGTSGGSAISAAGWRFNICQDPGRCLVEPADGISQWYRKMWQVRGLGGLLHSPHASPHAALASQPETVFLLACTLM